MHDDQIRLCVSNACSAEEEIRQITRELILKYADLDLLKQFENDKAVMHAGQRHVARSVFLHVIGSSFYDPCNSAGVVSHTNA